MNVTALALPPSTDLDPRLAALAATNDDGSIPDDGNELLRLWNASPDHAVTMMEHHFDLWLNSPLGPRLTELVRLAVANQTRCPICLSIRRPGARRAGVDEELVSAIQDTESPLLDDREQAAVAYAAAMAGDHTRIDADTYGHLRSLFSDEELAELSMMVISFLGMGRLLETLTRGSPCPLPR